MNTLWQDIRFSIRMLFKQPGFTTTAIIMLALGIGANAAIFTVVNAVLLRPLPYPDAERIVRVGQMFAGFAGGAVIGVGEPKFIFWREQSQSFETMAAYQNIGSGFNLTGGDEAEYVTGFRVSEDFFRVLGVSLPIGRVFTNEEDQPGGESVAILSNRLWQRRFGADPKLVGKAVSLNGQKYAVVGVMPSSFRFGQAVDVFVPMRASLRGDPNPNQTVIGKLKPGVTLSQAQAEMQLIGEKFREANPRQMSPPESVGVRPYQELFTSGVQQRLWILLGAVTLLLLIACANVANLQLTRSAARQKEIAIRMAIGAGWRRIVRQLLTEGVLLAIIGGALGLLLAVWGTDLLLAVTPEQLIPRFNDISLDWRVLAFTLSASVFTGLLFGLAPAVQSTRVDVNAALKEGSGQGMSGAARSRSRNVLIVLEVALSLVLLIGSTLLARTFANLSGVDPGFDPRNVLTFQISPSGERYDTAAETDELYRNAVERISRLPGVEAVAATNILPLMGQFNMAVALESRPDISTAIQYRIVTPDYFRVMKMAVRRGRAFTDQDKAGSPGVVIVNESYARRYLQNADPFGQRLLVGRPRDDSARQIVGVVGDMKQLDLGSDAPPMVFVLAAQVNDDTMRVLRRFVSSRFVVRTAGEPRTLSAAVKREMAGLDPTLPITDISSLEQVVSQSVAPQRFNMLLIGMFAGLGLLLAAVGIYGVMSYNVAQRTNEIGIRIALGARAGDVISLILKRGLLLALIGVAIGLAGALALTRVMKNFLFGVSPTDPLSFAGVAVLLVGVALLACFLPARRAAKVDPLVALRSE